MRRILTLCLTFHWTTAFGLLCFFTVRATGSGQDLVESLPGLELVGQILGGIPTLAVLLLAVVLSLNAALFFRAFLTVLTEAETTRKAGDDALRAAFAASIALTTLSLVLFAVDPEGASLLTLAVFFAALLASYVVIAVDRRGGLADNRQAPAPMFSPERRFSDIPSFHARDSAVIYPFPKREP